MVALRGKDGVEARNGYSYICEILQSHFKTTTFCQGSFPHHQFSGHQIRNSLTERHAIVRDCNVYLAGTVNDNFIKIGGDDVMR